MSRYGGKTVCPICGHENPEEAYVKDGKAVGCDQCITVTPCNDYDPGCDLCGYLNEEIYSQGDDVIGCDQCIEKLDPEIVPEFARAWHADLLAPVRRTPYWEDDYDMEGEWR